MNQKTALIFGSSGLTGGVLLQKLLDSGVYNVVKAFVRKPLDMDHPALEQVLTDFDHLEKVSDQMKGDDIFLCLGTTMAKAGSKAAFYKVDYTYTVNAATIARKNGIKQVILISSMGADAKSMVYYSKVKGKVENALAKLDFVSLAVIRPSLLLGDRKENRFGEKMATSFSHAFSGIFIGPFKKYKPIASSTVADAMLKIASKGIPGKSIYESDRLEFMAKSYASV
jgi:uncharacterized protein YbjT (DUF2867 family)